MDKIDTKVISINDKDIDIKKIKIAADIIKNGGVVAFPTETVYGLGANALDDKAIQKIFLAKGRPQDNPLIVHVSDINGVHDLVKNIPSKAYELMEMFWPGPLTLIFNKSENVPLSITAGLDTVAIRMPKHKIALELIDKSSLPIAAPSANTSGKPSPTDSSHVIEDLAGKIDMIIDGGAAGVGVESTVLDITSSVPVILRPGAITKEDLLKVFPEVKMDPALSNKNMIPKSPGQKYKHYSPKAKVKVILGKPEAASNRINELINKYKQKNIKIGIMATEQTKNNYINETLLIVGDRNRPQTIASNLFKVLREFDKIGVDIILAEGVDDKGIGKAIMNRLYKAAGGDVETI